MPPKRRQPSASPPPKLNKVVEDKDELIALLQQLVDDQHIRPEYEQFFPDVKQFVTDGIKIKDGKYACILCDSFTRMNKHDSLHYEQLGLRKTVGGGSNKDIYDRNDPYNKKRLDLFRKLCKAFSEVQILDFEGLSEPLTEEHAHSYRLIREELVKKKVKFINFPMRYTATTGLPSATNCSQNSLSVNNLMNYPASNQSDESNDGEDDGSRSIFGSNDDLEDDGNRFASGGNDGLDLNMSIGSQANVDLSIDMPHSTDCPQNHIPYNQLMVLDTDNQQLLATMPNQPPNCFTGLPNLDLIYDTSNDGHYVEEATRQRNEPWSAVARDELKWGYKLAINVNHAWVIEMIEHDDPTGYKGQFFSQSVAVEYMRRLIPISQSVTVYDIMYSISAMEKLLKDAYRIRMGTATMNAILKTIAAMIRLVSSRSRNQAAIRYNFSALFGQWESLKTEWFKKINAAVVHGKKDHNEVARKSAANLSYCCIRRVIQCDVIYNFAKGLMRKITRKGSVTVEQYEFIKNYLINCLVLLNVQRNELVYKSTNGSFVRVNPTKSPEAASEMVQPDPAHPVYVGIYGQVKNASSYNTTTLGDLDGLFAWNEKVCELINWRLTELEWTQEEIDDENGPFFYKWDGEPVMPANVTSKVYAFWRAIGLKSKTCIVNANIARHGANALCFDDYVIQLRRNAQNQQLAQLQHHTLATQHQHYTDDRAQLHLAAWLWLEEKVESTIANDPNEKRKVERLIDRIDIKLNRNMEDSDDEYPVEEDEENDAEEVASMRETSAMDRMDQSIDNVFADLREEREVMEENEIFHVPSPRSKSSRRSDEEMLAISIAGSPHSSDHQTGPSRPTEPESPLRSSLSGLPTPSPKPKKSSLIDKALSLVKKQKSPEEKKLAKIVEQRLESEAIITPEERDAKLKEMTDVFEKDAMERLLKQAKKKGKIPSGKDDVYAIQEWRERFFTKVIKTNVWMPSRSALGFDHKLEGILGLPMADLLDTEKSPVDGFVRENDTATINSLLGMKPMTPADTKLLNEGFTLGGINTNNARFNELLRRRHHPQYENFPWTFVGATNDIGLGLFSADVDIPNGTILCTYPGRWLTHAQSMEYQEFVKAKRPRNGERLVDLIASYEMQFKNVRELIVIEGHRLTHNGRMVSGRFANHSACDIHCNCAPRWLSRKDPKDPTKTWLMIVFVATQPIGPRTPLLWNYGTRAMTAAQGLLTFPCPMCVQGKELHEQPAALAARAPQVVCLVGDSEDKIPERPINDAMLSSQQLNRGHSNYEREQFAKWNRVELKDIKKALTVYDRLLQPDLSNLKPANIAVPMHMLVDVATMLFHDPEVRLPSDMYRALLEVPNTHQEDIFEGMHKIMESATRISHRIIVFVTHDGINSCSTYIITPPGTEKTPVEAVIAMQLIGDVSKSKKAYFSPMVRHIDGLDIPYKLGSPLFGDDLIGTCMITPINPNTQPFIITPAHINKDNFTTITTMIKALSKNPYYRYA